MGDLIEQLRQWSPFELAAVTSALLYLVLAIRQNILCWLFAGISTAIYVYLFVAFKPHFVKCTEFIFYVPDKYLQITF